MTSQAHSEKGISKGKRKVVCLVAKQYENAYLSGKIMITCLNQCFHAIFTNSFEPQSFNYDPEMFYLLNTSLPSSSFALTSSQDQWCIWSPSGEIIDFMSRGFLLM